MGNCSGGGRETLTPEEKDRGRAIEKFLREEHHSSPTNILVLGAGESGKSTFIRQVRLLYSKEFSDEERAAYAVIIRQNILHSMKRVAQTLKKQGGVFATEISQATDVLSGLSPMVSDIDDELAAMIRRWWAEPEVQQIARQNTRLQFQETVHYFLEHFDRISRSDFLPNNTDIFHARNRTTGILELNFKYNNLNITIVDVGGQRSERKKWIHCFQNVACVLFFVSLSEYDERLFEDESVNRMAESLELFEEVVTAQWFLETPICVMFNKTDLFKQKIGTISLGSFFPDWKHGVTTDYRAAADFVIEKFLSLNPKKLARDRQVIAYETCALETESVRFVFSAIAGTIISSNLRSSGL